LTADADFDLKQYESALGDLTGQLDLLGFESPSQTRSKVVQPAKQNQNSRLPFISMLLSTLLISSIFYRVSQERRRFRLRRF
jgi:hypothetical protein